MINDKNWIRQHQEIHIISLISLLFERSFMVGYNQDHALDMGLFPLLNTKTWKIKNKHHGIVGNAGARGRNMITDRILGRGERQSEYGSPCQNQGEGLDSIMKLAFPLFYWVVVTDFISHRALSGLVISPIVFFKWHKDIPTNKQKHRQTDVG